MGTGKGGGEWKVGPRLDALQGHGDLLRRGRRDGRWHDSGRRGSRGSRSSRVSRGSRGGGRRVVKLLAAVDAGTTNGKLLPPKAFVAGRELLDLIERHILYHRAGRDGGGAGSLDSRGSHRGKRLGHSGHEVGILHWLNRSSWNRHVLNSLLRN